jgi:glucose-6-phosphate 1-dehydrogenase
VQPFLDGWAKDSNDVTLYQAGSSGPAAADALLAVDGFQWLPLT